jgi:diadenosine tetraphosphate (Ap4A) HIT family hydrolase
MPCFACDRIELIRKDRNDDFIIELSESYVTLADEQAYPGYCILHFKEHVEQLGELSFDRQARLWDDVARVADALTKEVAPLRLNYACLGNLLHHVHWHVIPRNTDDPEVQHPIWVRPLSERRVALPGEQKRDLIARLRQRLAR